MFILCTNMSFSQEGVRQRVRQGRTIVVYSDKVYDVTEFIVKHPGGSEVLEKQAGHDVTKTMMDPSSQHVHSSHAYDMLENYCVGNLRPSVDIGNEESLSLLSNEAAKKYFYNRREGYRDLVDWSKPVLPQIPKLGAQYDEWVHKPTDLPLRLFNSDFCEYFSTCSWWMIPLYWVPVLALMTWTSFSGLAAHRETWLPWLGGGLEMTTSRMPAVITLGFFLWTLLEYVLHRWLFHLSPPTQFPRTLQLHFLLHGQHHKAPMEKGRLVFPLVPANIIGIIMFTSLRLVLPPMMTRSLFAGLVVGYMFYDLTHYYLHHGTPSLKYFRSLKRYHVKHHFQQQNKGFGISSKFWDYPFNTLIAE